MKTIVLAALAALSLASAVDARIIYINPYSRGDGTPVQGHFRTTPDGSCLNNLGGC